MKGLPPASLNNFQQEMQRMEVFMDTQFTPSSSSSPATPALNWSSDDRVRDMLEDKDKEIANLRARKNQYQAQVHELEASAVETHAAMKALEEELTEKKRQILWLEERRSLHDNSRIKELENDCKILKDKLEDKTQMDLEWEWNRIDDLNNELDAEREKSQQMAAKFCELKSENACLEGKSQQMSREIVKLRVENTNCHAELYKSRDETRRERVRNRELLQEISHVEDQLDFYRGRGSFQLIPNHLVGKGDLVVVQGEDGEEDDNIWLASVDKVIGKGKNQGIKLACYHVFDESGRFTVDRIADPGPKTVNVFRVLKNPPGCKEQWEDSWKDDLGLLLAEALPVHA
jgi:hypothetical protein